jgi:CubicO group peptidase (beta-lactamase class C family)
MKATSFTLVLFGFGGLFGCSTPVDNKPPDDTTQDPRFAPIASAVAADLEHNNATGVSVAVWLGGEPLWVGGFGHADPEGTTPPGKDTLFMIGSDTKKITALSLLRKVAAGKVTLETPVSAVLPDLKMDLAPSFEGATVRQLLSHQSGLADLTEDTVTTTDADLASFAYGTLATTDPALVEPGRLYNYSNPNFSIAGLIDQKLDGRMWPDIVEQDLFAPLGMTRTKARKSEVDADVAIGRGLQVTDPVTIQRVSFEDTWESAFTRPAGLVWSTPNDQMRLAAFLVDGDPTILAPSVQAELTKAQVSQYPDIPGSYGFGLIVNHGISLGEGKYYDVPVWTHGGNTLTHTSTFFVLPEQRFAISILSNGRNDDFTGTLVAAIEALVELPPPSAQPALPFVPAELDGLTGTYNDPVKFGDIVVTREGDALAIAAPQLDAAGVPYDHLLTALTTRVWSGVFAGESLTLTFIDGPNGTTYLRSRESVAVRTK